MGILNRQKVITPTPESMNELRRQSLRLEQVNSKLKERDRALFEMVGKAVQKRDTARAQIYANELSRIRQIKEGITHSQLAIDCIMIRLENFLDLRQIVNEMKPISEIIKEVSTEVQLVTPQFATILEQLNEVANEALLETTVNFSQSDLEQTLNTRNQGSIAILEDVSTIVEDNLKENFPEPPITLAVRETEAITSAKTPTFTPRLANMLEKNENWSKVSDEAIEILNEISTKNRTKLEELEA